MSGRRRAIANVAAALGVAISAYTALLHGTDVSCGGGGCGEILHSSFASIRGVPVGLFSVGLWLLAGTGDIAPPWMSKAAAWMLVCGAVVFTAVQLFILGGFCLLCAAHALCSVAFALCAAQPENRTLPLALGLSATVAAVVFVKSDLPVQGGEEILVRSGEEIPAVTIASALNGERKQIRALSLFCGHCLEELTLASGSNADLGLVMFGGSAPKARELAVIVLSAAITGKTDAEKKARFYEAADVFLDQSELYMDRPDELTQQLRNRGLLPHGVIPSVRVWVHRQYEFLLKHKVRSYPQTLRLSSQGRVGWPALTE